jgi:pimeloyl-ACP methyl ester carboxylesterase
MGSDRNRWEPLVDLLHQDFRCITIDMPGHGDSPAEDMNIRLSGGGCAASNASMT